MEKKRYLKEFNSQDDYETSKKSIMGIPHVVWIEETEELIYIDGKKIDVMNYDNNIVFVNAVDVIDGNLILDADNIIAEEKNNQFNLIIE